MPLHVPGWSVARAALGGPRSLDQYQFPRRPSEVPVHPAVPPPSADDDCGLWAPAKPSVRKAVRQEITSESPSRSSCGKLLNPPPAPPRPLPCRASTSRAPLCSPGRLRPGSRRRPATEYESRSAPGKSQLGRWLGSRVVSSGCWVFAAVATLRAVAAHTVPLPGEGERMPSIPSSGVARRLRLGVWAGRVRHQAPAAVRRARRVHFSPEVFGREKK